MFPNEDATVEEVHFEGEYPDALVQVIFREVNVPGPVTHKFDTALPSLIEDLEGPSADFELPLNSLAYAIVIDVTLNPASARSVDRADQSVGFWPWFTFDGQTGKSPRPRVRQKRSVAR